MHSASVSPSTGQLFAKTQQETQSSSCVKWSSLFPASWYLMGNGIDIRYTLRPKRQDDEDQKSSLYLLCLCIFLYWFRWPFAAYEDIFMFKSDIKHILIVQYLVSAVFQLKMSISRTKLRSFISQVGATLTPRNRCFLNLIALVVSVNVFIPSVLETYYDYSFKLAENKTLFMEGSVFKSDSVIPSTVANALLIFWDQMIYDGLRMSMVLYCVSAYILYCFAEKKIKILTEVASLGLDKEMIQVAYEMKLTFDAFESLFCVCPFIWLVFGTLNSTYLIIRIIENIDHLVLTAIFFEVHLQITIVSVLLAISMMAEKIESHKSIIVTAYTRGGSSYRQMSNTVMLTLHYTLDNNFSIWRIGQISRAAILTYLGTIITFSVLFTQIKNGSLNN